MTGPLEGALRLGRRRRGSATGAGDDGDPRAAAEWLAAGERTCRRSARRLAGSPDAIGWEGRERYAADDAAAALLLFAASIGDLHTAYCADGMLTRLPGPADAWILDAFCSALQATLAEQPLAPVQAIAGDVTERLRSIAEACEIVGAPATLYRDAATAVEGRLTGQPPP
jgi:hypothetical protein